MEELILKQYDSEVKAVDGERAFNVTITTNTADRSGDIVEPKGAKLTNFRKNPVVLMAHNYQGLPIAKAKDLAKTDNGITAKVIFPDEGIYSLADTVYNLYKNGFMKAWSIGFIPIKSEDIVDDENSKSMRGGTRFKTWELLEFSGCAVPNNPDTLNNMLKKGIDVKPLEEAGFIEVEEDKAIKEVIKEKIAECKVEEIDVEKVKASIEEDEKEDAITEPEETDTEIKEFNAGEIYEIVKENYKLKEIIKALKELELKAGAVLNAKNKQNLKKVKTLHQEADTLIQSVLDSATTGEEDSLEITALS